MDAVLSYHMNGLTCGVAKFNYRLAEQLAVPMVQLFTEDAASFESPLLSIKISEFTPLDVDHFGHLLDSVAWRSNFRLFLHAWTGTELESRLVSEAREVYCGNSELAGEMTDHRADVKGLWCPGTLEDTRPFNTAELSVFTFGMAHKIRARHYDHLRQLLDATGKDYGLYLSTALHENTSFDEEFSIAFDELREIFGDRVYFLGYLSDNAVYNYLRRTTYFAAFFDHGVRANNTSVNLAMQCGAVVITNLDEHSPEAFTPMQNLIDIKQCEALPTDEKALQSIGRNAELTIDEHYGWDALGRYLKGAQRELTPAGTPAIGGQTEQPSEA